MIIALVCEVIFFLLGHPTEAFLQSGLVLGGGRAARYVYCRANLEYRNGNICCLNCPAGTHVKNACATAGEMGICQECEDGTYTEHGNGLHQCLKCTVCHLDQEVVRHCTTTQNTECQCKPGTFCAHDQACELCKKCSTCKQDEEKVRNCTSTTNTQCKKILPSPGSDTANNHVLVGTILCICAVAGLFIIVAVIYWKKRRSPTASQNTYQVFCSSMGQETSLTGRQLGGALRNLPVLKAGQNPTDEMRNGETLRSSYSGWPLVRSKSSAASKDESKRLCESLNSSASNSQRSLTCLPSSAFSTPSLQAPHVVTEHLNGMEEERFLRLIPVNGEESLRQCFVYFEEMDIDYHKRFFRSIGINDNIIKSKDHLQYEDKIYELLNIWLEKEGRNASLNGLLKALLDLSQRHTAEMVKENAIQNAHYILEF